MSEQRVRGEPSMAERMEEALSEPPRPDFWPKMTEILRQSAEIDRLGTNGNPKYTRRSSGQFLLHHLATLLNEQSYFQRRQEYLGPLMNLSAATWDLNNGRVHPALAPADTGKKNVGQHASYAMIKGMAARALAELLEGGMAREAAARAVAMALPFAVKNALAAGTRSQSVSWKTVAGWRDKLNEGTHDEESAALRLAYERKLGPEWGNTATERGNNILAELRSLTPTMV